MWWLITVAAIAIAIFLVVVRWGGSDVRFIGRSIGVALNIKPHLIEQMALKMGQERSSMLAKQLKSFPTQTMQAAVTTTFIYQISLNMHPKNVEWWQQRVVERGFDPRLNLENVEIAFMYLRDAGSEFDILTSRVFLSSYIAKYES
ncbi:DUF1198 family protein [Pseudomonas syringae]|uniref:DUF1198 family protein n=1 Tax=Pseudomonas syringae TaxID=317 RepID=UPI00035507F2|nr:DUF1198 family protein [Pseudomonas syringae]EPM91134.1 hypothetical protein A259_39301 [Pseudomonas syringae pv. actinidiae ICMP 19070]AQL40754.1 hypothetical protein JN853_30955 [Pseudomonas syringae pv. actinidiae ICMP 9853]EPM90633.1 hypothetical protein A260_00115 [Pseudomonas syringae pv. actinidiae ICMP 19068]EPM99538.1 hypothetical protein A258_00080 [Pseudomonas syringae pv. actinidiae ICMP 19104]EPN13301.1 hypothetical protein A252_00080 [Pseudomonas syringae pv. actinidiae ICMP 9